MTPEDRAKQYAAKHETKVIGQLGYGQDGTVFKTDRQSALKVFHREQNFSNELKIYHILDQECVDEVNGHAVPQLWLYSYRLLIIEISIVRPPYLLDFAKATVGERESFSDDVWNEWLIQREELFGDRWPDAEGVMNTMAMKYNIYLNDINPGNLRF